MGKQVNTNFDTFQSSEEVISDKHYQEMIISSNNSAEFVDSTEEDLNDISSCSLSSSVSFDSTEEDLNDISSCLSSSSSSSSSNGPLYQLSDLMDQLPIKRGLSKYYQGKSQSFTTLASAGNLEDLAKRENPYMKKIKLCKTFGGFTGPKTTISKKSTYKTSYSSSILRRNCSNNFMATCRLPSIPVHKDF